MREVSVEGLRQIGQGVSGVIYRYDDDKVLKIFRDNYDLAQVERAYNIARFVSESDVPTPKVYEMVQSGNNFGIISEFIDASPLQISIYSGQTGRKDAGYRMGKLLRKVHALKSADFVPPMRQMIGEIYDRCSPYITEDVKGEFLDFIDSFPGKGYVLHGDFHENNIMVRNDEFILLDLDSLCIGSPLFEFQQSFTVYRAEIPVEWQEKTHYTPKEAQEFINTFLESYFETDDAALISEYDRIFTNLAKLNQFAAKILQAPPEASSMIEEYVRSELPNMRKLMQSTPEDFDRLPWK